MKQKLLLFICVACLATVTYSQTPQAIPYQAVARNINNDLISNQTISLRFSIHDVSAGGTVVFRESQTATTNALGLFSLNIGQGLADIGIFSAINWSVGPKFIQVEMDTLGGINFVDMGTQQMLSVPYSLFSLKSADLPNGNASGDVLVWNGTSWVATPKCNLFNYYYRDKDQDAFGDPFFPVLGCSPPLGFVNDNTDCDDNNPAVNPSVLWYIDGDGDGFTNNAITIQSCTQPPGYLLTQTLNDCNDNDVAINPGASDLPDDSFMDTNCDLIDGTVSLSVFVAISGSDANPGTMLQPKLTIGAGILAAQSLGKTMVLISAGTYLELVTMANGISLHGGYNAASAWSRSVSNIVNVIGPDQTLHSNSMEATNITSVTYVDRIKFLTSNASGFAPDGRGKSSYGGICTGCSQLIIKNCTFQAGNATSGNSGSTGNNGASGSSGGNGLGGNCNVELTNVFGGPGGTSSCGRTGGAGGTGGSELLNGTGNGLPGSIGVGPTNGGNGGIKGDPGFPGIVGLAGSVGSNGSNGTGGAGGGIITYWAGSNGTDGSNGLNGNGGGGGGGGGGQVCTFCVDGTGNGGGGGGAGGCLGSGGIGGKAGGGSFGLLLINSNGIILNNNSIISKNGGSGGAGMIGGIGGNGGNGGSGGTTCTSECGAGGNGGAGGKGGNGGISGGGSGGPSYGIYRSSTTATMTGNTITVGFGGNGGSSPGSSGTNGVSATIF